MMRNLFLHIMIYVWIRWWTQVNSTGFHYEVWCYFVYVGKVRLNIKEERSAV
jgi:hypothetical protein